MADLHRLDTHAGEHPVRRHHHLWRAVDGTGLHAPPGKLTVDDETGELCCHVCGEFFRSLGGHVRTHGYTADEYRWAMGLGRRTALVSNALSSSIADRQRRQYEMSHDHRRRLSAGRAMAREAQPTGLAGTDRDERPETIAKQRAALDQGRSTVAARRESELRARLDALGIDDLPEWLSSKYSHGASIEDLARSLGVGRGRVRNELDAAGVAIRRTGVNSAAGKRSRIAANDVRAAQRLGLDDVREWLVGRRRDGSTLSELSAAVGHSTPWVRARLDDQ